MGDINVRVVTTRTGLRIGEKRRPAGYELTEKDMEGRNVSAMERRGEVATIVEHDGAAQPRRSPRGR